MESVFFIMSDYNANQCFLISEIVDRLGTPQQLSALGQYTLCVYKFFLISGQLQFTIYLQYFTMKAVLVLSVLASAFAAPDTR